MVEKSHVEQLLKINGVLSDASDDEIKSVLVRARWHEKDVEQAIALLKNNLTEEAKKTDPFQTLFKNDAKLRPDLISSLLGVDITILKNDVVINKKDKVPHVSLRLLCEIIFVSIVLSCASLFAAMWYLEMGVFHITMR